MHLRAQQLLYTEAKKRWDDFVRAMSGEIRNILDNEPFPPFESLYSKNVYADWNYSGCIIGTISPDNASSLQNKLTILKNPKQWIDAVTPFLGKEGAFSYYVQAKLPNTEYFVGTAPYTLPLKQRLEHQLIIGASGSGKTQLIQRMICDDIENGRSVVVIDSQRDMIQKLLRLKHGMDLLYIDPENIESPPGIALFDVKFGTGREAEAREAAVIQNYEYMFSVFGSELTGRQGSIFTYALRLMFHVPDSNIHTLISLFRGEDLRKYIGELPQVEREFFEKEFLSPQYKANREQILAKLNIIVSNRTLRRIFENKRKVFDFHEVLSRPCVTLISTSRAQLQTQGCALFGRFMLSLVVDAITQRAHIPEDKRLPTFIYVDEGKDYGNDDAFERIIYECRKYGAGLIFCSQNMGQLSTSTISALFTSGIKLVRAVKEPAETRKLCQTLRVEDAYLHALEVKDREYAQWACQVRNKTMTLRADFGYLENRSKLDDEQLKRLINRNTMRFASKPEPEFTFVPPDDVKEGELIVYRKHKKPASPDFDGSFFD